MIDLDKSSTMTELMEHTKAETIFKPADRLMNQSSMDYPIADTLSNGFFTVDKKWQIVYWNKASERLLKKSESEVLGKNMWDSLADILPIQFYYYFPQIGQSGSYQQIREYWAELNTWFDIVIYNSDTTTSVSFKPYHAPEKYTQAISPAGVSEVYQLSAQLSESCLWEWNIVNSEVFWINGNHKRIFGYPLEHILLPESFFWSLIHPDDIGRIKIELTLLFARHDEYWNAEYRMKCYDGSYVPVKEKGKVFYNAMGNPNRIVSLTTRMDESANASLLLYEQNLNLLKKYTAALMDTQEAERQYIGTEISDNFNQLLTIARFYIQMSDQFSDPKESNLHKSNDLIGQVVTGLRDIVDFILIPDKVMTGLFENISDLSSRMLLSHAIKVNFTHKGILQHLIGKRQQLALLRITQMLLRDIARKGHSKQVSVQLNKVENDYHLIILVEGWSQMLDDEESMNCMLNVQSKALQLGGRSVVAFDDRPNKIITTIIPVEESGMELEKISLRNPI